MNRLEFVIAIAAILFVAFILGWAAHMLLSRFSRVSRADLNEIDATAKGDCGEKATPEIYVS